MAELEELIRPALAILAAIAVALLLTVILRAVSNRLFRKIVDFRRRSAQAKYPVFGVFLFVGVRMALNYTVPKQPWFAPADFVLMLGLIAALIWLALATLGITERLVLRHFSTRIKDNRRMRRLTTQITLGRRIVAALLITLAVAGVLLTIPEVRALGTGLLASAGLISIVAGLAVQSSLSNVFAGVQLAFTDAIRIDDVVVVEGLWGRIEEITMTYVVVRVWDERMLILPSTYFTTTPFENWTRNSPKIMGSVELDLDWQSPVPELRAHLDSVLAGTPLWDGRTGKLEVTDAVNGMVRIRIVVSAKDSGELWTLRCLVRESMLTHVQQGEGAIPRQRWEMTNPAK
ncbi:mechanosensitive ion channel family protein [Arthrobacter cryoconiti]|uniref:Mechanosensitive ion channel family protein n=1 Tax=Arthrobacter cryoconiti TaxID=748907 RepID=A0ABV8QYQ0_9MICC|nr:mechanosensitive ion channel domain-containing protein [Arthrobacter cryoconiti]MCC9068701.1 mechanosensitive ion channel family protein [Arthrobacter cryoconiti]